MSQPGFQICYNTQRSPYQVYTTNKHQLLTNYHQLDVSAVKTSPASYLTKMMGGGELDKSASSCICFMQQGTMQFSLIQ